MNAEVLDALGTRGCLVNVARGTVIDEAALVKAQQEKRTGGAALDVFEREPQEPPELFALDGARCFETPFPSGGVGAGGARRFTVCP